MQIVITIQHPAHVHFFKNIIQMLERDSHQVHVFARVKDLVPYLLEQYSIDYKLLADEPSSPREIPLTQLRYELKLLRECRRINPDLMMAIGGPGVAHVGTLCGATTFLFTDTEHARFQLKLGVPFADRVYTCDSFTTDLGANQRRYDGLHELAYLHPNWYEPDSEIRSTYDIDPDRKLAVVRTISWDAVHDIGHSGFDRIETLISELESEDIQVFLSAEGDLPSHLDPYQVTVPPQEMHDLLYHADLLIGESGTMTLESAVLGTPAVFVSSFTAGVLEELNSEYNLVHVPAGNNRIHGTVACARRLLEKDPEIWQQRRQQLLADKVDTTEFIHTEIQQLTAAD